MPLFEAPVGPQYERNAGILWPTAWTDSNTFEHRYEVKPGVWANHTGADLNQKVGEDENAEVYSMGDGVVTFSDTYPDPNVWGGLVIIYHGVVDNKVLYSRYAHVKGRVVTKGQKVLKGQQIAQVGGRELGFDPHLHFDISTTSVLDGDYRAAGYWPGTDLNLLRQHFVNPLSWLRSHQQLSAVSSVTPAMNPTTDEWLVTHPDGAQIRKDHGIAAQVLQKFNQGSKLTLKKGGGKQDGYLWGQISGGSLNDCWVAIQKEDRSEVYLSKQPG
jgi:hypothetical protein